MNVKLKLRDSEVAKISLKEIERREEKDLANSKFSDELLEYIAELSGKMIFAEDVLVVKQPRSSAVVHLIRDVFRDLVSARQQATKAYYKRLKILYYSFKKLKTSGGKAPKRAVYNRFSQRVLAAPKDDEDHGVLRTIQLFLSNHLTLNRCEIRKYRLIKVST